MKFDSEWPALWTNKRGTELWMKFLDSQVFHLLFILLSSWILNYFNKYYDFLCDGILKSLSSFLGLLSRRRRSTWDWNQWTTVGLPPTRHDDAYRDANMHCSIFITLTLWMFIQIIYAYFLIYSPLYAEWTHIFCLVILFFLDLSDWRPRLCQRGAWALLGILCHSSIGSSSSAGLRHISPYMAMLRGH